MDRRNSFLADSLDDSVKPDLARAISNEEITDDMAYDFAVFLYRLWGECHKAKGYI